MGRLVLAPSQSRFIEKEVLPTFSLFGCGLVDDGVLLMADSVGFWWFGE